MYIRAADLVSQIEQYFGDSAHAGPAYAHKMNMLNFVFHTFVVYT